MRALEDGLAVGACRVAGVCTPRHPDHGEGVGERVPDWRDDGLGGGGQVRGYRGPRDDVRGQPACVSVGTLHLLETVGAVIARRRSRQGADLPSGYREIKAEVAGEDPGDSRKGLDFGRADGSGSDADCDRCEGEGLVDYHVRDEYVEARAAAGDSR